MIPDFQMEMIEGGGSESGGRRSFAARRNCSGMRGMKIEERLETGAPREVISRIVNEENFDLIIIGRQGGKGRYSRRTFRFHGQLCAASCGLSGAPFLTDFVNGEIK